MLVVLWDDLISMVLSKSRFSNRRDGQTVLIKTTEKHIYGHLSLLELVFSLGWVKWYLLATMLYSHSGILSFSYPDIMFYCYHVILLLLSCYHVILLSCYSVIMLFCYNVILLSCLPAQKVTDIQPPQTPLGNMCPGSLPE